MVLLILVIWQCLGTLVYRGTVAYTTKDRLDWTVGIAEFLWPLSVALVLIAWIHDTDPEC